jgi:hypothetical protein
MTSPVELCVSGANTKQTFAHGDMPPELFAQLQAVFPWVKRRNYMSISSPTYHEVVQDDIITCCLPRSFSRRLLGNDVVLTDRKFCMNSAESYLRAYYVYTDENPDWLPTGCNLLFYTENLQEYGRPFPSEVANFADYYFTGDPAIVEDHFDLDEIRGEYTTLYGVTKNGDNIQRVKQYCYHEETSHAKWLDVYNFNLGN